MADIVATYLGNEGLLRGDKVAFLAPGHVTPLAVLPSYDWALEATRKGKSIVSGFHSALEKDVWKLSVDSGGSMILVLVRPPFMKVPERYRKLIQEGRLLIVFLSIEVRLSRWGAKIRNRYVCELAESIVFPCMNPKSSLFKLFEEYTSIGQVQVLCE